MRIFFSAGEPSGDQHAAHLIRELRRRSDVETEGFGGPEMSVEGCALLYQLTDLAVMGVIRVIPMLAKFRRLVIQAERHFDRQPPDAVVLVDFPGFNWWIAKAAKKRGIPVYFYMPPQLWAWAPWRIRRIRKWVDHVICNLPFEYDWYRERNVAATWVGHPFFDEVADKQLEADFAIRNQIDQGQPVVAVLPGSRNHEIERNFPVMLAAMERVSQQVPDVHWLVGNYSDEQKNVCQALHRAADTRIQATYFVDRTSEVIAAARCCFMVSGSISLELLARRTPGVVLYRVSRIAHLASKIVMTCPFITLTNLIAGDEMMPEFISSGDPEADIDSITDQLVDWCQSETLLNAAVQKMSVLADRVAVSGATVNTADLLLRDLSVESSGSAAA